MSAGHVVGGYHSAREEEEEEEEEKRNTSIFSLSQNTKRKLYKRK
jgi:hypothetical protein